jgi:hypothetical protein
MSFCNFDQGHNIVSQFFSNILLVMIHGHDAQVEVMFSIGCFAGMTLDANARSESCSDSECRS